MTPVKHKASSSSGGRNEDAFHARPIVAVPARNEADRLPFLIEALARQSWLLPGGRALNVVIVLNNCDDGSDRVLEAVARSHRKLALDVFSIEFPPALAHVGSARRLAMDRACEIGGKASIILSTDADAIPSPDWVDANLRAVSHGADIVGGHIVGDAAEEALLGPRFVHRAKRHLYYTGLVDKLTTSDGSDFS